MNELVLLNILRWSVVGFILSVIIFYATTNHYKEVSNLDKVMLVAVLFFLVVMFVLVVLLPFSK